MQSLVQEFKALAVTSFGDPGDSGVVLAKRPDKGGTLGRQIQLCANVYRIKFRKSASIAHYDVNIVAVRDQPAKSGTGVNRETSIAVWDALVASNPDGLGAQLRSAAYDNRNNAFCLGKLDFPNGVKVFRVSLPAETDARPARVFDVKLQLAQLIDLAILEKFCEHQRAANVSDLAATAIMALDVLLRHGMYRRTEFIPGGGGRKFLSKLQATPLGEGGQLLAGLFQSVRPTTSGIVLNADSAFTPYIITGKLLDVCNAIVGRAQSSSQAGRGGRGGFRGGRGGRGGGGFGGSGGPPATAPFNEFELHQLKRKLKGAKVRVTHRVDRRVFAIQAFGQPAGRQLVSISDRSKKVGKRPAKSTAKEAAAAASKGEALPEREAKTPQQTMTVAEYFAKTYKRNVDPKMQCVELRGGQFVPMDCLELVHGTAIPPTKLTATQAAAMINVSAKPPAERRAAIDAIRKDADFGPGSSAEAWGLEVDASMMKLTGRILPPPKVAYHQSSVKANPSVAYGAWNLIQSKFLQPGAALQHWSVVVYGPQQYTPPERVKWFFDTLMKQAKARGMKILDDQPRGIEYWDGREDLVSPFKRACNKVIVDNPRNPKGLPPQMVFCLLSDPKRYDEIKRKAAFELPVAVLTQVLLIKKAFNDRGVDQYCGNVCLKLNAKLGGVNSTIAPVDLPGFVPNKTLLLGADVTHPTGLGTPRAGSEDDIPPSIAAVVGAVDGQNMQYAAQVREQEGRKEFITDLEDMSVTLIQAYVKNNKGVKPEKVIMFRDGVSEGQLAPVVHAEVSALKRAFKVVDAKWVPKLTYIVCAKRHHIRFFAANPNKQGDVDRTGNLPPGVVVDTAVTHPYIFDMYIQSQCGLKGTAKPTRYMVLLDEIGFGSDQIEKLINSLCFSFARATRSVSLVPVAYYADIVAGKARSFVTDDDASTTTSGVARARQRDPKFIQQQLDRVFKTEMPMGSSMWFI
ncbi:Protein argonaute [Rhodotorula kratochvilovae]